MRLRGKKKRQAKAAECGDDACVDWGCADASSQKRSPPRPPKHAKAPPKSPKRATKSTTKQFWWGPHHRAGLDWTGPGAVRRDRPSVSVRLCPLKKKKKKKEKKQQKLSGMPVLVQSQRLRTLAHVRRRNRESPAMGFFLGEPFFRFFLLSSSPPFSNCLSTSLVLDPSINAACPIRAKWEISKRMTANCVRGWRWDPAQRCRIKQLSD